MKRCLLSIMLVGAVFAKTASADSANELFNPNPDKSDVIVSMPCNGIMVFKKVYTSNDTRKIKDKTFTAGILDTQSPMSQAVNTRYVQGAFKDKKGYYYLIGKYELLKGQFDILMSKDGKCPTLNKMSRLPAVKISYFDAVNAADAFSRFISTSNDLKKLEIKSAYSRLATDEEWEFAARGGNLVTQSEFDAKLPPMTDGELSDYAWYQGATSANGKLQLAGLKKPNPLGLYDMFGNAQEMTVEPFRAVRAGRLLGQPGGICSRGGSYLSSPSSISSASRTEKPLYQGAKPLVAADTSTRFVLSSSVAFDTKEAKQINDDLKNLGEDHKYNNALSGEASSIAKLNEKNQKAFEEYQLQALDLKKANEKLLSENSSIENRANQLKSVNEKLTKLNESLSKSNVELNTKLVSVQQKIMQANSDREAMQENAVTANLRLGGFLCRNIDYEKSSVDYFLNILKISKKQCDADKQRCRTYEKLKSQYEQHEKLLKSLLTYYGDAIVNAETNFSKELFKKQLADAKEAFGLMDGFDRYVDLYLKHLSSYSKQEKDLKKNQQNWLLQCSDNK
ncbi:MAG: SUMF1/EgtB/PvdO family nonheme iron enzyme [Succinatimonas hippei]|nr:SUMF1/EgtB/PvdO family nonheme iron enzyme [Succinatimonas hippei]